MSGFDCPKCGTRLKVIPLANESGGWERGQAFALGAPPPGSEYSREVPAADLSGVEAGVKAPLFQALLTGAAVGAVTVILTIWKSWPWVTPIVAAVIAAALAWWLLLLNTRGLLKTVEQVIGRDLDGDGQIGFSVEITDLTGGKKQMRLARFPGRPEHVRKFAQTAVDGAPTPEGAAMSRRKFNAIRDEALRRGLVTWKDEEHHTQGLATTLVGKAVFRRLIDGMLD